MLTIVLAAVMYATYQILASYGAQRMSDIWFVIFGGLSQIVALGLIAGVQLLTGQKFGSFNTSGIIFVFFANVGVALYVLFLGRSFQQFDAKLVIPVVVGGAILLSTIATYALHRSIPSLAQVLSLALISGGLMLLGLTSR